jgi:hypothetical protein
MRNQEGVWAISPDEKSVKSLKNRSDRDAIHVQYSAGTNLAVRCTCRRCTVALDTYRMTFNDIRTEFVSWVSGTTRATGTPRRPPCLSLHRLASYLGSRHHDHGRPRPARHTHVCIIPSPASQSSWRSRARRSRWIRLPSRTGASSFIVLSTGRSSKAFMNS